MKKHCTLGKKSLVILIEMLSVLGIVGIVCFMYTRCIIVTDNKNYSFLLNPFEEENYEDSDSLAEMFDNDSADMIYYLALCQQFESNGEFDKEKTIDLLEYYYRKQPESMGVSSKGALVYKVQDLINWGNTYGVTVSNGIVDEKYYPIGGNSVYDKNLVYILDKALPNGIWGFEQSNASSAAAINVSRITDTLVAVLAKEQAKAGEQEEYVIEIDGEISDSSKMDGGFSSPEDAIGYLYMFLENDMDSLSKAECSRGVQAVTYLCEAGYFPKEFEKDLSASIMEEFGYIGGEKGLLYQIAQIAAGYLDTEENYTLLSYEIYEKILISVINDLKINYERYQDYRDYFVINKLNFKYLYLPEEGEDYYSNLEIGSIEQAREMAEYFNDGLAACVVIEPAAKNVVERSSNVTMESLLPMLDTMGYAFQKKGGTIYLGVLENSIAGFAAYDKNDHYATAQRAYANFRSEFMAYLFLVVILLAIAIVFFVLYSCMCGHRAWYKVVEEDGAKTRRLVVEEEPSRMKYFDKLFTEVGLGAGIALLTALTVGFMGIVEYLLHMENFLFIIKNRMVLVGLLVYTGIFYGIWLFFYGSLVRRIKLGILWKESLCAFLLGKISSLLRWIKELLASAYYNRGIVSKICLFYIPLMLGNFILITIGTLFLDSADEDMGILLYLMSMIGSVVFLYFVYKNNVRHQEIIDGIEKINGGEFAFQLNTEQMKGDNLKLAEAVNHIGIGIKQAVEISMKDERLKADLITNVSHDIKTPLTSIINYVDLLKRENVQNDTVKEYIEVLDVKSQRLKQLTEDLVEASKISSGNITLVFERLHVVELMNQIIGEFSEKFQEKNLDVITNFMDKDAIILADGRRMWRVFENLFGNIYKYAMPGTRVYLEVYQMSGKIYTAIKNISMQPLNIDAEELTERFIRGDISRSTEGSGLGLSIAKSLVIAQQGEFKIYLDGDLFKVTIVFQQEDEEVKEEEKTEEAVE